MLEVPLIRTLLSKQAQSTRFNGTPIVECEYPFAIKNKETIISGTIDRLILWQESDVIHHIEIIDYKMRRTLDEQTTDDLVESCMPQLKLYKKAISTLFTLPPNRVSCRLVFPSLAWEYLMH